MQQTLVYIPDQIAGIPLFGVGLLLIVWAMASAVVLVQLLRRQGFNADTRGYVLLLAIVGAAIWLLLPRLCEPGSGLPIRGYGTLMLVAVVAGTALAVWRGRQLGIDADTILGITFWLFVPGIIGARIFYVIEYWSNFYVAPAGPSLGDLLTAVGATVGRLFNVAEGGLVVYGSLIGGLVGILAFTRTYKLPVLATFDLMAPSLVLGAAIGRIGCLLNGCCFGGACDLPWAVEFPPGSPPYFYQVEHAQLPLPPLDDVRQGKIFLHGLKVLGALTSPPVISAVEPGSGAERVGLKTGQAITVINGYQVTSVDEAQRALLLAYQNGPTIGLTVKGAAPVRWRLSGPPAHTHPIHPTQLYSAIDSFVLCLLLLAYDPFRRRDGELIALMLTIYPITRFLMEMIRTDEPGQFGTGLTISQWVSLAILACVIPLWFTILRRPAKKAYPLQCAT